MQVQAKVIVQQQFGTKKGNFPLTHTVKGEAQASKERIPQALILLKNE